MTTLVGDVRIVICQCRRQPAFASAVLLTLALAIGATVAVFSVVNAVLLRDLPFASADRLVWITSVRPDNSDAPFSLPEFMDYREQTRSFAGIAAYANWSASLAGESVTERLQGARMSANSFDVLGVSPTAGRVLRDSDDRADAPRVAVLSYRLWQRRFGGAADAVGKSVRINGDSVVIIGVLPSQFPLPLRDIDVITSLAPDRDPFRHVRGSVNFLRLFGRLKPGVTAAQGQLELTVICRSLRQQYPIEYVRKDAVRAVALRDVLVGDCRRPLMLLLAAVIVVFAAALTNLVALMLVRANERRPELSVRVAIGASRLQLMRPLAVEALLLTLVGATLAWVLAAGAMHVALGHAPDSIPRLGEVNLDTKVFAFAIGLAAVVTVLLSVASFGAVLGVRGRDVFDISTRTTVGDRWGQYIRRMLIIGETSAALVLLVATYVVVQSVVRLQSLQPGFNPDAVFQARVSVPESYRTPGDLVRFYERLSEELVHVPGVEEVGVTSAAPLSGLLATIPFDVPGRPARSERDNPIANFHVISPGYLPAVRTRILAGRPFGDGDRSETPPVALVSSALAERFLANDALGRQLLIVDNGRGPRTIEIIGVVENVRLTALDAPPGLDIYLPLRQIHPETVRFLRSNQFWMVRTKTDPAALRQPFVARLRAVDQDAGVSNTGTMRQYLEASLGPRRFMLWLLAAFSLTAVVLVVTGQYGLISYTVGRRRREIALRMALGATERHVQLSVVGQAAGLGFAGSIVGLGVVVAARPIWVLVGGGSSVDPAAAIAMIAVLVGAAIAASWLPARRASRIEPTLAFKVE